MAEAREKAAWNRAALLAMLIAEPNRDPDKRPQPFSIATFHPHMDETEAERQRGVIPYSPAILEAWSKGMA